MTQTMSGKNPPRLSQILRSFLAFLVGILVFTFLALAFKKIAGVEAPPRPGEEKPVEVIVSLAAAMLLAGYGTARIAGRWEIPLSAALGVLMSLGAGPAYMHWQGIERPLGQMISLLVLVPSAALGGWVSSRMARARIRKRAEEPLQLPLVIRQRTIIVWFAFVLSLGMTAAAAWAMTLEDTPPRIMLGVLFFGATTLFLGWRGLRNSPLAILREDGIEFPASRTVIPWSEIEDAVPHPLHPVEYVRLRVRDPQRYLSRMTPLQRALTQTGEPEPNIGFALTGTPYTSEEIRALIRVRIGKGDIRLVG